jgi:hypothetical protein
MLDTAFPGENPYDIGLRWFQRSWANDRRDNALSVETLAVFLAPSSANEHDGPGFEKPANIKSGTSNVVYIARP